MLSIDERLTLPSAILLEVCKEVLTPLEVKSVNAARALYHPIAKAIAFSLDFPDPLKTYLSKYTRLVPVFDYVDYIDPHNAEIVFTPRARAVMTLPYFGNDGFCLHIGRHLTSTWCLAKDTYITEMSFRDKVSLYRRYHGITSRTFNLHE